MFHFWLVEIHDLGLTGLALCKGLNLGLILLKSVYVNVMVFIRKLREFAKFGDSFCFFVRIIQRVFDLTLFGLVRIFLTQEDNEFLSWIRQYSSLYPPVIVNKPRILNFIDLVLFGLISNNYRIN